MDSFRPFFLFYIPFTFLGALPIFSILFTPDSNGFLFIGILCTLIYLLFPIFIVIWYVREEGSSEFVINNKKHIYILFISFVIGLSFNVLWCNLGNGEDLSENIFYLFKWDSNRIQFNISSVFFMVRTLIFMPVFEIILIIGLVQKPLLEKMNPYIAIILTAVIFSILHLSTTDIYRNLLLCFLVGMIYSFTYYKTKNLLVPILCCFLMSFQSNFFRLDSINNETVFYSSLIGLIVLFASSFGCLIKYNTPKTIQIDES